MFPFLSVLCAVIGIFMLFILMIMSTRVIEAGPTGRHNDTRDPAPRGGEPGIDEATYRDLEDRIRHLRVRLEERHGEYQRLLALYTQLADLLKTKESSEVPLARRLGAQWAEKDLIQVVPDASQPVDLEPIQVEVKAGVFVVYPELQPYPLEQLRQPKSPLRRYLDSVYGTSREKYLVLLVRPNGVSAFDELRKYLAQTYQRRVPIGYEPIPDEWKIAEQNERSAR